MKTTKFILFLCATFATTISMNLHAQSKMETYMEHYVEDMDHITVLLTDSMYLGGLSAAKQFYSNWLSAMPNYNAKYFIFTPSIYLGQMKVQLQDLEFNTQVLQSCLKDGKDTAFFEQFKSQHFNGTYWDKYTVDNGYIDFSHLLNHQIVEISNDLSLNHMNIAGLTFVSASPSLNKAILKNMLPKRSLWSKVTGKYPNPNIAWSQSVLYQYDLSTLQSMPAITDIHLNTSANIAIVCYRLPFAGGKQLYVKQGAAWVKWYDFYIWYF